MTSLDALQTVDGYEFSAVDDGAVKISGLGQIGVSANTLLDATKPLSVFQLWNPNPAPEYRFGDSTKPFPETPKYFNIALLGPLATGGPFMKASGEATILGQKMGWIDASAGLSGVHGKAIQDISLKLGPLGRVTIQKMVAEANIDKDTGDNSCFI